MITVFGDAPDENKELAETETCEGDGGDYIFEPSENPWVRTRSLRPKKRKDRHWMSKTDSPFQRLFVRATIILSFFIDFIIEIW